ncbi:MAG: hypothetical protein SNJ70_07280 [Armatimonadota bacterium]
MEMKYYTGKISKIPSGVKENILKNSFVEASFDEHPRHKSPMVACKISNTDMVGVTDVLIKGGNGGSLYQFNLVRDYSDKFYFLKPL